MKWIIRKILLNSKGHKKQCRKRCINSENKLLPSTGYIARSLNHQQKEETMGERIVSNCGALKISKDDGTLRTKIKKFQMWSQAPEKRSKTSSKRQQRGNFFDVFWNRFPPAGRKDEVVNMIRVPKIHSGSQLPTEMWGSRCIPPPNGTEKKVGLLG